MASLHFRLAAVACLCVVLTAPSGAAVIERDWRTPGDGLLTHDTISGREWLDLSVTRLADFPGATLDDKVDAVLAETAHGGEFEGFRHATLDDILGLAASAGIDPLTLDDARNRVSSLSLAALLSDSAESTPTKIVVSGAANDLTELAVAIGLASERAYDYAGVFFSDRPFAAPVSDLSGVWLYQIPEPASLTLVCCSLSWLLARPRK